jgi:transcription elongation factor Elf1
MFDSALTVSCPHCKHRHKDILELLEPDNLDAMRCDSCTHEFSVAVMECHRCADEQVFTWQEAPAAAVLDTLKCQMCGSGHRVDLAHERDL